MKSVNAAMFVGAVLAAGAVTGCGGEESAMSGRYGASFEGESMEFDFHKDGTVTFTMNEDSGNQSMDCNYQKGGDRLTINCAGGEPMQLTLKDGALEADMGGMTMRFTKR